MRIACFVCGRHILSPEEGYFRAGVGWALLSCTECEGNARAQVSGTDTVMLPIIATPAVPLGELEPTVNKAIRDNEYARVRREQIEREARRDAAVRAEVEARVHAELAAQHASIRERVEQEVLDDLEQDAREAHEQLRDEHGRFVGRSEEE